MILGKKLYKDWGLLSSLNIENGKLKYKKGYLDINILATNSD